MCTSIIIKSKSGNPYWGRTMDFVPQFFDTPNEPAIIPSQIINIPANYEIHSELENWKSKYAIMGVGLKNSEILYDGINEKGLVGDIQILTEATHASLDSLESRNLKPVLGEEFFTYILSQCKNITEVKELTSKLGLLDQKYHLKNHELSLSPHYTFMEESGAAVVLEPTDNGAFKIYDSVGVMTNSPEYSYHTNNIRNYISLNDMNITSGNIGGKLPLEPIEKGTGYGLFGLPGDYTSPSRFVRSMYIANNINDFSDEEAIPTLYNVFKPVMIPKGMGRYPNNHNLTDYTQYWSGYDIKNRTLYLQIPTCLTLTKATLNSQSDKLITMDINEDWKTNNPIQA
ncbi:choloylglycine hydrolase [Fructilactobacillus lindneri]|uniref:linear amide C-N hydrolase n=1 Tax=Fructilactobacillus lindneri TaxID=53444 RepID=UPI00081BC7CE|nr:linear amide C-N hydrolase [Fructilactobacillus lindneri]POG98014.1 choloylglycine hydrolase [Fructilactobacillus lindneri]POG99088.1 choloylglycine hydrolase [Fructilactobacillus lindneri]POH01560.1 choloylglycine hydrolase [Fructilactobacillus lindneri]POH07047.1 choloylglycine hydrolase [Fructilactobacillus lindneri]